MAHVPERFEVLSSPKDVVLQLPQLKEQLPFKLHCYGGLAELTVLDLGFVLIASPFAVAFNLGLLIDTSRVRLNSLKCTRT